MYFSKNSRCVLQRVRFLSPTFLQTSNQNLCMKKPKDDPTKPPLRINIPKDLPQSDGYPKLIKSALAVNESKPKNIVKESKSTSLGPNFEDGFLYKSESEIQFSKISGVDDTSLNHTDGEEMASFQTFNTQAKGRSYKENDYNEGLRTVLNDEGTEAALAEIYENAAATEPRTTAKDGKMSKQKSAEVSFDHQLKDSPNSPSLYIIIDVPQKGVKEIAHSVKDKSKSPKVGASRQKVENASFKTKYSSPKLDKSKSKLSKNFEVHQIEDESTYVFHLKFNPKHCRKPCGVGWVPEKEVTTRTENFNYNETPIRVKKFVTAKMNRSGKENVTVDEFSKYFKHPDNRKKEQNQEIESKGTLLSMDKKWGYETSPSEAEIEASPYSMVSDPEGSHQDIEPTNTTKRVSLIKEKRKIPQTFERDDFGSVRAGVKNDSFKVFGKVNEAKREENELQETVSATPAVNSQEDPAEASSNPVAEVSEMSNVEIKETSEALINASNLPESGDRNFPPEIKEQYRNRAASAQNSNALYLETYQKVPPPSVDTYKKSKIPEYFTVYENEPVQSQSSFESAQDRNGATLDESTLITMTENNQPSEELQYMSIHEKPITTAAQMSLTPKKKKNNIEYIDIHAEKANLKTKKSAKNFQSGKKSLRKKLSENSNQEKLESENSMNPRLNGPKNEATDFQTSYSFVSIGCDKASSNSATYGAAFPPFLREALNSRFRFKKDFLFNTKWQKVEVNPNDANSNFPQKYKVTELSENSILFPKNENEKFDCDSLFSNKEEIILNIIKNEEESSSKGHSDNVTNVASFDSKNVTEHAGKSSIDSLSVMKKVKEIIRFDFENSIKIFKNGNSKSTDELPSVVILKGDSWEVDNEELEKQMLMRRNEMKVHNWTDFDKRESAKLRNGILGDKTEIKVPKYLPSTENNPNEMKLCNDHFDSVITYNPKTKTFFINEEALADAKDQRTKESLEEIAQNLDILVKRSQNSLEAKSGDSILVFDEESQSWKVDFSILEKREQQLQMEKELTKTSEIILETFEKLEKDQLSKIPKPDSRDKKTFDYQTEKWRVYDQEKKLPKSKSPFRESDAEEIRRKNSDLYENLFVAKKKEEATMKKVEKIAPGLDSSNTNKESKSESSGEKIIGSESNSLKTSSSAPKNPNPPTSESILPSVDQENPTEKEEDSFWESFIEMNILPPDSKEIPKAAPSSKPSLPKSPTSLIIPPDSAPKIEDPKLKIPEKKIEEPKLKIPERKIDEPKSKIPEKKIKEPKVKTPEKKPEEPKFKIQLPFIKDKIVDLSIKMIKPVPKDKTKPKDEKKPPPPTGAGPQNKETPDKKAAPPSSTSAPQNDLKCSTTGSINESFKLTPPSGKTSPLGKIQDPKGKNEKIASAAEHYVSDKIIEISKNKGKENQPKIKTNKMETVKLNITADKRLPSKITEINLSKKLDEKSKDSNEAQPNPVTARNSVDVSLTETEKSSEDKKELHKNLEKYKTPFSDPEYEENSMKIKSDIESNPNLKKLDTWNKTLVLHDIMKPSENIDSWLKDETDKMATLLLKILQEAANGKPKKKQPFTKTRTSDKNAKKGNPYENIRKKQEVPPESFLFRVRTVNLSLEGDKKSKQGEGGVKVTIKPEKMKDLPVQSEKNAKPSEVIDAIKFVNLEKNSSMPMTKGTEMSENLDLAKSKVSETALEAVVDPVLITREFSQQSKFPLEITEEIPGPEILKKISNAWKLFPILGSQMTIFTLFRLFRLGESLSHLSSLLELCELSKPFLTPVNLGSSIFGTSNPEKSKKFAFTKLFTKYGPIVNVQGPLSGNVILIHKPEHLTAIFEQDVSLFVRSVFDSVEKTRRDSEDKLLPVSISTDWTKPEWSELKKETDDPLCRNYEKYFRSVELTGDSLVNNIRKNKNAQDLVSEDFMTEIRRWSLEGLCNVLFEKSFGFLEGRTSNMNWIMEPDKLYMAVDQVTRCLNNCERGFQAWRLMATPSSSSLGQGYRTISSIFQKQLYQAEINLKNKSELLKEGIVFPAKDLTFMESMLLNDGMTPDEIICNLVDITLIGTNMMNSAMGFLLYNLAQNVKVQNKLLKELKEALPNKNSPLNYNKLQSLKYLKACLSESLRLHVPVPVFYKMLQNDVLLANYIVPKGTYVVMDYRVSCMKETIFDDPEKYIPERWLNDEKWMHEIHPFTSFPLCHGPRADSAKRIVEMQMLICIAKIIRNFQIEYHYGEIQETNSLMSFPDKPLKFNFIERES